MTETVLVHLVDDLWWIVDGGNATNYSCSDIICKGEGSKALFYGGSILS